MVVENRPGANGNTVTFADAKLNDGHTLLLCGTGALAITALVYSKLPFDPSQDLRGVTLLADSSDPTPTPHPLTPQRPRAPRSTR